MTRRLNGWREGDDIDGTYTVVRVVTNRKGYVSVIATADARPATLTVDCTCGGNTPQVAAYDAVTEVSHTVCGNCRMRKRTT